ncbi:hypothetical protein OAE24_00935 [Candidatus Thioglobus sp.]|nr:hypothetical protein [Candidatus Thioglobus sp.]
MKNLLLILVLSLLSIQSFAAGCPDGSEPVKSISADGTYFVFECGGNSNNDKKTKEVEKKPVNTSSNTAKKTPSINGKPKALEMVSSPVGKFNIKKLSENSNQNVSAFSSITNKFDINQDGHDDLILGNTTLNIDDRNLPNEFSKPVILFWDNNTEEYIVDIEVQKTLPLLYFPRRIHGSINPTTGLTHLFIADTGLDLANYDFSSVNLPPNCGAQNHLITYDPSSKKVTKVLLPKLWDYTHALASADLNGDQITDYVVLNSPYIKYPQKCLFKGAEYTNGSYILYSNKNGSFDKVNIELNYKGYSKVPTITSAIVIVDDNKDTFLVLGSEGSGSGIYAFKQDSKASFTESSRVNAPAIMAEGGNTGSYSEVLYADVDSDGSKEVVASINTHHWKGRYIQLLDFSNGELRDRSEDVVQSPSNTIKTGNDWCHHLFFNKKTAWNKPILTCTNLTPTIKSRGYFYNWDENKLQPLKIKSKNKEPWEKEQLEKWVREIFPVTINQKNVYVGHGLTGERKVNGNSFYDIKEYYLIKPPATAAKASNAFDGSYSFTLERFNPSEGSIGLGRGVLEIKDGKISVVKKSRQLKTSSTSYYDTFEGQIDKQGNITSSFTVNALKGKGSPQPVNFLGRMNELQIKGKFDDYFEMIINIKPIKALEPVKNVGEAANSFDGAYAFLLSNESDKGIQNIGSAQFIIKDGKISVARKYRYLDTSAISTYDTFEGVIDKEGNINVSFEFNPIRHMVEPKTIMFSGSMDSLQLRGGFDEIKSWDNNTKAYVLDENFYPSSYDVIIDFKKEKY